MTLLSGFLIALAEGVACGNRVCKTGFGLHHGGDVTSLAHLRNITYWILIHRFHFEI